MDRADPSRSGSSFEHRALSQRGWKSSKGRSTVVQRLISVKRGRESRARGDREAIKRGSAPGLRYSGREGV